MAGHSKWANIKHKKGKADAKRGKVFSRVAKEIISAVKQGSDDPKTNPKLRLALQKAKAVNMPQENIQRNIKKGGSQEASNYEEITYEFYGHGGIGLIVLVMTDNKNRTATDMRIAQNKCGTSIASPGSVSYQFEKQGMIVLDNNDLDIEKLFALILEAGADDLVEEEEVIIIYTPPAMLYEIKDVIEADGFVCKEVELAMIAKTLISVDSTVKEKNIKFIDYLEELDDVDSIYHNMQF